MPYQEVYARSGDITCMFLAQQESLNLSPAIFHTIGDGGKCIVTNDGSINEQFHAMAQVIILICYYDIKVYGCAIEMSRDMTKPTK